MFQLVPNNNANDSISESFDMQFEDIPNVTVNDVLDDILTREEYGNITICSKKFAQVSAPFGDEDCYLCIPLALLHSKIKMGNAVKTRNMICYTIHVDD